jgi:hypothetical protein
LCITAKLITGNIRAKLVSLVEAVHVRPELKGSQNSQRSYDRYLALARAQAQAGDLIGAENYYQHAEHYFRSMSSGRGPA